MSALGELFRKEGVEKEKILEIVNELKKNPMGAMALVQKLSLSVEVNQKIMEIVMMQPNAIDELAAEVGISAEIVQTIKEKIPTSETKENCR